MRYEIWYEKLEKTFFKLVIRWMDDIVVVSILFLLSELMSSYVVEIGQSTKQAVMGF